MVWSVEGCTLVFASLENLVPGTEEHIGRVLGKKHTGKKNDDATSDVHQWRLHGVRLKERYRDEDRKRRYVEQAVDDQLSQQDAACPCRHTLYSFSGRKV